jgi:polyisoprenoid-binding protein YceI
MSMKRILVALMVCAFVGSSAMADKYALTGDNTKIEFTGTKPDGKHTGGFKKLSGSAEVAADAISIAVEIDVDSMFSDNPGLTQHLKGADFFGVKDNPKSTFKSTKVTKDGDKYTVTGDFTLLGKTKSISFPATITSGETFTLKAAFKINRTDYGMVYGKGKVDDEVSLTVDVTAKK